jgi:hypothetical protein
MSGMGTAKPYGDLMQRAARTLHQQIEEHLQTTPAHTPLQLPPGEYDGPALIAQPLHLRGHGMQTVLWSYESPVLLVTSPGVILENLMFDVTAQPSEVVVLYRNGCQPVLRQCLPAEVRALPMSQLEEVIQLGVLQPNVKLELPIVLPEVADGYQTTLPPYQVRLSRLPASPQLRRGFMIEVAGLKQDGILMETMQVRPKNHGTPLDILIVAQVGQNAPQKPLKLPALRVKAPNRLIHIGHGLELTNAHLQLATNRAFSGAAGVYAHVLPQNGECVLWLPATPPAPVRLNGKPVPKWERVVLEKGHVIDIAGTELIVEDNANPGLKHPASVTVRIDRLAGGHADFELGASAKKRFPIGGGGQWEGEVHSLVRSLVTPAASTLKIKDKAQMRVEVNEDVSKLDNGKYLLPNALVFTTQTEVISMDVHIDVNLPEHLLAVDVNTVSFINTPKTPLYQGELSGASTTFVLENQGRQPLDITLTLPVKWLEIPSAAQSFQLPSGKTVSVPVKLTALANQLIPDGKHQHSGVILISRKHGQTLTLSAETDVLPSRSPSFDLRRPNALTLTYDLNRPSYTPNLAFSLSNLGPVDGYYRCEVLSRWFEVTPPDGLIAVGATRDLQLTLSAEALRDLRQTGMYDAVLAVSGGRDARTLAEIGRFSVSVEVVDRYSDITSTPLSVNLGTCAQGDTLKSEASFTVQNIGTIAFQGNLRPHPGVSLSLDHLHLAPGQTASVKVSVRMDTGSFLVGEHTVTLFDVEGNPSMRKSNTPRASFTLTPPEPMLQVLPRVLWTGVLWRGHMGGAPALVVRLSNYGRSAWVGEVKSTLPSLLRELYPTQTLTVPPKNEMVLKFQLMEGINDLETGSHRFDQAISLVRDDQTTFIPLWLILDEPRPKLRLDRSHVVFKPHTRGDDASGTVPISLTLRNEGAREWEIDLNRSSAPDWVLVSVEKGFLETQSKTFIELRPRPAILKKLGNHTGRVILSDGQTSVEIGIQMNVVDHDIRMTPERLEFHLQSSRTITLSKKSLSAPITQTLTLHNHGVSAFQVRVGENLTFDTDLLTLMGVQEFMIDSKQAKTLTFQLKTPTQARGEQATPITLKLPGGSQKTSTITIVR